MIDIKSKPIGEDGLRSVTGRIVGTRDELLYEYLSVTIQMIEFLREDEIAALEKLFNNQAFIEKLKDDERIKRELDKANVEIQEKVEKTMRSLMEDSITISRQNLVMKGIENIANNKKIKGGKYGFVITKFISSNFGCCWYLSFLQGRKVSIIY